MNDSLDRRLLLGAAGLAGFAALARSAKAGPLDPPPGPVAPTGKTIGSIEPRVDIATLPGSGAAVHVISQPGSYYLSSNIDVPSGKNGLHVTASNVTIDLNGFAILGVDGSVNGIRLNPDNNKQIRNITILNGFIHNFDNDGVNAAEACAGLRCDGVCVRDIGASGFYVWQALLTRCRALDCGSGFLAFECGISDCSANNCGTGFAIYNSRLGECAANFCGTGLDVGSGSQVVAAEINGGFRGVFVRERASIRNCHISEPSDAGIHVWEDFPPSGKYNVIEGNTLVSCGDKGIRCNGPDAVNNLIIANRAINCGSGPGDAYAFSINNRFGPIIDANIAVAGDLSTVGGANHPLANLAY